MLPLWIRWDRSRGALCQGPSRLGQCDDLRSYHRLLHLSHHHLGLREVLPQGEYRGQASRRQDHDGCLVLLCDARRIKPVLFIHTDVSRGREPRIALCT